MGTNSVVLMALEISNLENPDIQAHRCKARMICYAFDTCIKHVNFVKNSRDFSAANTLLQ